MKPPIIQDVKLFVMSSDNIIQTIYAGEEAKFKFQIKLLNGIKEAVQVKILNPPKEFKSELDQTILTKTSTINLTVKKPDIRNEAKYKIFIEARCQNQVIVFPFILNIIQKQDDTPRVIMDFVTREFNPIGATDAIIGKAMPEGKKQIHLTFSSLTGAEINATATTDPYGNFSVPLDDISNGLYDVNVTLQNYSEDITQGISVKGKIQLSPPNITPQLCLSTNNARLLDTGDSLLVTGKLTPSPGIVPIELLIVKPTLSYPDTLEPDTVRIDLQTDPDGFYRYPFPIAEDTPRGIYKIISRYDLKYLFPQGRSPSVIFQNRFGLENKPKPAVEHKFLFADNSSLLNEIFNDYRFEAVYHTTMIPPDLTQTATVECVVYALLGEHARPGIVIFVVGGSHITIDGNPYYFIQTEIINNLFRKLIKTSDAFYRQFIKSDFIYFNPQPQDIDGNGNDTESIGNYNKTSIQTIATSRISSMASNLTHDVPLYVIMLGQGVKPNASAQYMSFRINGTTPSDLLNVKDVNDFLTAIVNSSIVNNTPRINRVFLLISCDYAGEFGTVSRPGSLPTSPQYCDFAVVTSTSLSNVVFPMGYQSSFTWLFFESALGFSPHLSSSMTEEQILNHPVFNLKNHFDSACNIVKNYRDNGKHMTPTWSPPDCNTFFPIGYNNKCVTTQIIL